MALNPQERATTANQMMQILNNSGGGGDGLTVFETTTTVNLISPALADRVTITASNFPELYADLSEVDSDLIQVNFTQSIFGVTNSQKINLYKSNIESTSFSSDKTYIGFFTSNISYLFMLVIVIGSNTYSIRRLDVTTS